MSYSRMVIIGVGVCLLASGLAPAAEQQGASAAQLDEEPGMASSPQPAVEPPPDWIERTKNPAPWWNWGADLRTQVTHFENAIFLDDGAPLQVWQFERFRARWWNTLTPEPWLQANVRLTWEGFIWDSPNAFDEWQGAPGYLDNLNVALLHPGELPVSATLGRQDIILGDGWLVLDGTPFDNSRTIFFDAARLTFDLPAETSLEAIYLDNAAENDGHLPTLGNEDEWLSEQDERGAILWLTHKHFKPTELNGYFIYKHDDAEGPNPPAPRAIEGALLPSPGIGGETYALGARAVHDFDKHWNMHVEGAYEFGHRSGQDLSAFGANSALTYAFLDKAKSRVHVNYEFLSGDDPDTDTNEAFNILWGRWARFSELLPYTYAGETRIADFTNMHRIGPGYSFVPCSPIEITLDYDALFADENTYAGQAGFSDGGAFRGHLLSSWLKYTINRHVSGHVMAEVFFPGNYYDETRDDTALFLRGELTFTW